ncbi:MAG: transglutaminase-like domain-containing protein [Thermoanaerobaculia bacterium]|nr:transglutaminase-like domain-containing protein [Thermoanaerobaculia bacterium]
MTDCRRNTSLRSRWTGSSAIVALLSTVLLTATTPVFAEWNRSSGRAVAGLDVARLLPPAGATIEPYHNNGYRLEFENGEVRIEVDASAVGSTTRWKAPTDWPDDSLGRLARSITAGATSEYQASSRILGWVSSHVSYELDRSLSQEPFDILERRTAYCTGFARLAVGLLRAAGLEAREVAGYVLGPESAGAPRGFHRWIETRFSDVGWVFSDPLSSHHYVPATYLRLGSETVVPDAGLDGLLIERRDQVIAVDIALLAPPGVRVRRNEDRQLAAALRVEVPGAGGGLAVLEGNSERLTHTLVGGTTTFLGLEPGDYLLELRVAGLPAVLREFELPDRGRTLLRFDLAELVATRLPEIRSPASSPTLRSPDSVSSDSLGARAASPEPKLHPTEPRDR